MISAMKALVYTRPMNVEVREMDAPQLRDSDVLVRVRACGVCGSDLHGFRGKSSRRVPPLVLGHEFSGDIVENKNSRLRTGSEVAIYPLLCCGTCLYCSSGRENLCPSRRVFGLDLHGGLAEFVAVPENCLFPLAPEMSHIEGALVEPLANALHILSRIPNVRGATGLIYGAGPIGFLSAYAARGAGAARLLGVDRNPHRLQFASHFGADLVIDASKEDPVEVIRGWTPNGRGVDFAIEAIGTDTCRRNAITCTAAGGTVACVGLDQEICEVDTRPLVIREVDVRGVYAYTRKEFAAAIEMLAAHRLDYNPWVTTASMDSGQRIFEELAGGHSPILKAIFLNNF
jgi:L-iditol 2-dehydrogenase